MTYLMLHLEGNTSNIRISFATINNQDGEFDVLLSFIEMSLDQIHLCHCSGAGRNSFVPGYMRLLTAYRQYVVEADSQ